MWGAQLAKVLELNAIATCSPPNFDRFRALGADAVFDNRSPTCGADIREHTKNELRHARVGLHRRRRRKGQRGGAAGRKPAGQCAAIHGCVRLLRRAVGAPVFGGYTMPITLEEMEYTTLDKGGSGLRGL
ncbi:hypothetical protein BX600DRAFT_519306 [Xylariales sp. PMI_506]|nr:hypothetical protein BX600DRAFT_519306 [Xylariales sp. PMI_506]